MSPQTCWLTARLSLSPSFFLWLVSLLLLHLTLTLVPLCLSLWLSFSPSLFVCVFSVYVCVHICPHHDRFELSGRKLKVGPAVGAAAAGFAPMPSPASASPVNASPSRHLSRR